MVTETVEARQRLFRQQVERLALFGLDYVRRYRYDTEAIERQRDNLLQMIQACGRYLGDWEKAAHIALGLEDYVSRRGRWRSWASYLEEIAAAMTEKMDPALRGLVWHALGNAYCGAGQWEAALHAHHRALALLRRHNRSALAQLFFDLGRVHWFRGEWSEALRSYRRADRQVRLQRDATLFRSQIANVIGLVHWRRGAWRRAVRSFRLALRLCPDASEYARNRSLILSHLALVLTDLNRWQEAERRYREAIRLAQAVGDTLNLAYTWGDLGDLYRRQEQWEAADHALERAKALWERVEELAGWADYAEHRGHLDLDRGDEDSAHYWLRRALTLWRRLGNASKCAEIRALLAAWAVRYRDYGEIERWMNEAYISARRVGRRDLLIRVWRLRAVVERARGDLLRSTWCRVRALTCALPALHNDRVRWTVGGGGCY